MVGRLKKEFNSNRAACILHRFRCHTGHAYSIDSLLAEITEKIDESLWSSIRSIEEGVMLLRYMAQHMREHDAADDNAEQFLKKALEAQQRADLVRQAVMDHEKSSEAKFEQNTQER